MSKFKKSCKNCGTENCEHRQYCQNNNTMDCSGINWKPEGNCDNCDLNPCGESHNYGIYGHTTWCEKWKLKKEEINKNGHCGKCYAEKFGSIKKCVELGCFGESNTLIKKEDIIRKIRDKAILKIEDCAKNSDPNKSFVGAIQEFEELIISNYNDELIKKIEEINNPYSEKVFIEPTHKQYEKFNAHAKKGGFCIDAYNGSWGRKVFNFCREDIIKLIKEEK